MNNFAGFSSALGNLSRTAMTRTAKEFPPMSRARGLCSEGSKTVPGTTAARPAIERTSVLKDGREATVRRLEPREVGALASFHAKRMQFADLFAHKELSERAVRNHFLAHETPGEDALAAIVADKVVGTATIEAQPLEMELPIDGHILAAKGMKESEVCVGRMMVDPDFRGIGVGRALKEAQLVAAADSGYKAVAGLTHSAALKHVVRTLGGSVQEGMGQTWTVVRCDGPGPAPEKT
ncbi:GNAT family N-acetyltransferase [Ramlibacter rhizophilus]|uniref:N-acetyltransferase n=1 Tax=Ramlibacter rhizophilus TaxID=1781167 RepID=A0A4Z0BXR7_9BURK|nr:GNAT family N-acetyltransferase [Ramlibacter rhizophilus]TFZ03314.1 N-acetyltransferase [Ramlibacter rhizophilus]